MSFKSFLICNILMFILLSFSLSVKAADTCLCTSEEKTLFSCKVDNKLLSVCASKDLSSTSGYLQYRYGTTKNLELVFPKKHEHPRSHFRLAIPEPTAKSSSQQLSFFIGQTEYIVFVESAAFDWNGQGVVVQKSGQRIMYKECSCKPSKDNFFELKSAGVPIIEWRDIYTK